MTVALLQVRGLTKRYLGLTAVDEVSYEVEAGTVVGLIGPNGSGKSTIVDCISGFQPADGGRWLLDGHELTGLSPHRIARAGMTRTFQTVLYMDEKQLVDDVRTGHLSAGLVIPPQFSRDVYQHARPRIGLVMDNTDNFMTSTFEQTMNDLVQALNQPEVQPRVVQQAGLQVVELYPYIEYLKYLLPGSITLAMFVSVMIGGGIVYIDDKARGVHEGYLVTPITKMELVAGLNIAGAFKAMGAGIVLTIIGSLIAGVGSTFYPANLLWLLLMIVLTSFAFVTMMFLIMVRVNDPLVPRAIFGILNTLLYFPSGAIYPVQAFPKWLQWIAWIDPFTYSVHGFKAVILKGVGIAAIWPDVLYLCVFAMTMFIFSTLLFKRTL